MAKRTVAEILETRGRTSWSGSTAYVHESELEYLCKSFLEHEEENERLRAALEIIGDPTCEHLHHEKRDQHESGSICPVVERVKALRGGD